MAYPKLATPNLFPEPKTLRAFAMDYGFQGVDWTLRVDDLPANHWEEAQLAKAVSKLTPLEVRYHLFFPDVELGDVAPDRALSAQEVFRSAIESISRLGGRYATIHVGLGMDRMDGLSWVRTISGLRWLEGFARSLGVRVCLENLFTGWTAEPDLYGELIERSVRRGTLDIGHARVCEAVADGLHEVDDFVRPHPERILSAHVYHEETASGHAAPERLSDIEQRLSLLEGLPLCDWWVLELRDEESLVKTLNYVRQFQDSRERRMAL